MNLGDTLPPNRKQTSKANLFFLFLSTTDTPAPFTKAYYTRLPESSLKTPRAVSYSSQ